LLIRPYTQCLSINIM